MSTDTKTTILGALSGITIASGTFITTEFGSTIWWVGLILAILRAADGYFTNK